MNHADRPELSAWRPISDRLTRSSDAPYPRTLWVVVTATVAAAGLITWSALRAAAAPPQASSSGPTHLLLLAALLLCGSVFLQLPGADGGYVSVRLLDLGMLTALVVNGFRWTVSLLILATVLDCARAGWRLWYLAANIAQRLCAYASAALVYAAVAGPHPERTAALTCTAIAAAALSRALISLGITAASMAAYFGHTYAAQLRQMAPATAVVTAITTALLPVVVLGYATDPASVTCLLLLLLPIYALARRANRNSATALRDELTGLGNRRELHRHLRQRQRNGTLAGVIAVDLDGLKRLNDTLGHAAGDAFITDAGRRMQHLAEPQHTVCRVGGDEFVVIVAHTASQADIDLLAVKIHTALGVDYIINDAPEPASASVGTASFKPGQTLTDLLAEADAAMYGQKLPKSRTLHRLAAPQGQS